MTCAGPESPDQLAENELWTVTGDEFPGGTPDEVLEFLNNAPAPAALINQLITDFHGDLANRFAEKIYANVTALPETGPCPTFPAYAHYASTAVGRQLRARVPSGRRRRARALVDGNRDVAYTVGRAAHRFLHDLPIPEEPPPGPAHDLWDGFMRYRDAERSPNPVEKSRLILEGNERILAFEQRLLDPHLGVAFRITFRRVTSPMNRFSTSQRRWRIREPGRLRLRMENAVARLATWGVTYVLPGRRRLRARRNVPIATDKPHDCRFPDTKKSRVRCWMCFDERMNWIVRVFHLTHHDHWFDIDETNDRVQLRRAPRWRGYDRAVAAYRQRYLSGAPGATDVPLVTADEAAAINRPADDAPPAPASDNPSGVASSADWGDASAFYAEHRADVFAALMARSLPATFCSPIGAPVLDPASVATTNPSRDLTAKRLAGESFPRLARTVQFIDAVFAGGPRRVAALEHVRRRHSTTRNELGDWRLGVPINQEHLLATVATFVCPVREVFDEFAFSDESPPWDAWARVWCEIGVWLGLDQHYLRTEMTTADEPIRYGDVLRVSRQLDVAKRRRNVAGVRLMDNMVGDLSDGYPRAARSLPLIALWSLGDQEVLRMLMVPQSLRGRLSRIVALRAVDAGRPTRWVWRSIRGATARWILNEIDRADELGPFDSLRYFPPDCSVTNLDDFQPVEFAPVEGANLSSAL